jgi:hypothetical protein
MGHTKNVKDKMGGTKIIYWINFVLLTYFERCVFLVTMKLLSLLLVFSSLSCSIGCDTSPNQSLHNLLTGQRNIYYNFDNVFWNVDISLYDSSVGIALGYGLDDQGSMVRFPAVAGNFSLHHRVQNVSGARPASYPMGTRGSFPGGKAAGA